MNMIMWEARRKALEPPKRKRNGNQTGCNTSIPVRDFVQGDHPRKEIIINPRTGLRAETLFSSTVLYS